MRRIVRISKVSNQGPPPLREPSQENQGHFSSMTICSLPMTQATIQLQGSTFFLQFILNIVVVQVSYCYFWSKKVFTCCLKDLNNAGAPQAFSLHKCSFSILVFYAETGPWIERRRPKLFVSLGDNLSHTNWPMVWANSRLDNRTRAVQSSQPITLIIENFEVEIKQNFSVEGYQHSQLGSSFFFGGGGLYLPWPMPLLRHCDSRK